MPALPLCNDPGCLSCGRGEPCRLHAPFCSRHYFGAPAPLAAFSALLCASVARRLPGARVEPIEWEDEAPALAEPRREGAVTIVLPALTVEEASAQEDELLAVFFACGADVYGQDLDDWTPAR